MNADCHIHMLLDGEDWKKAIARHSQEPDIPWIRNVLSRYQSQGITYLRDGGDRWGVCAAAKSLAGEYGITYKIPLAPLCKVGHYGAFIGNAWQNLREYALLVQQNRANGADFVKIMISGLMDFDRMGVLTSSPLTVDEIRELVHIAHEEGFSVMAHCNGARTAEVAATAGVDSIEHGAYLDTDALMAMKENRVVWVPTLSTIGNLRGKGRFDDKAVCEILDSALQNLVLFSNLGGFIAPGSDAGAWSVPHGSQTEYALLCEAMGKQTDRVLCAGLQEIINRF